MKIRAFIVEDISHSIKTLELLLKKYDQIELLGFATSMEEAIPKIKELSPDLLFMDIKLGKNSGFDVLEQTQGYYEFVIFTTAYSEFALNAFNYQTINYLLKPIDPDILESAIERVTKYFENKPTISNLESEVSTVKSRIDHQHTGKTIFLPEKNSWIAVNTGLILYIKAEASYSYVVLSDRKIKVSKNLSAMEKLIDDDDMFFRVHRSFIINTHCIKSIKKGNESSVELINDEIIPISINEKNNFFTRIGVKQDNDEINP
jgi:two-component system LytT family response regulator